jgi:dienelactone hydrolase
MGRKLFCFFLLVGLGCGTTSPQSSDTSVSDVVAVDVSAEPDTMADVGAPDAVPDLSADQFPSQLGDAVVQTPELPFPCVDDYAAIYAAQAAAGDPLGAVVACQVDHEADASQVAERLLAVEVEGVEVKAGYRAYRIAYRTNRDPQTPGTGTARLYVPDIPGPRPVVVVAHGSAGLADFCAPSTTTTPTDGSDVLALPWVASGYVTVLPDYAGLGNPGTQGYGNRVDTTFSAIDAGRAAVTIPGTLPKLVFVGHSQGGGVALAAQALTGGYGGPDLELAAAVSIGGNLEEDRTLLAFRFPNLPVIVGGGGLTLVVVLLTLYADWANIVDVAQGGAILHPDLRDHLVAAIQAECIFGIVPIANTSTGDYEVPNSVSGLVDPTLRAAIVACDLNDNCTDEAAAFVQRHRDNVSPPDPDGAPVLMLSGVADLQSPLERQACTRDFLQAAGVVPTTCAFEDENHFTIPQASIVHGLDWVKAILAGQPPPDCPDPYPYPECPPN